MNTNNFVLICDDNYVMPTIVTVRSIDENINKEKNKTVIYVLSWELTSENVTLLSSMSKENFLVKVKIINKNLYTDKIKIINQNTHVTPVALLKFEIADILKDIDTVLYLDSDLIILKDLSEIFEVDLTEKYLAASFDYWKYLLALYEKGDCNIPDFYFNSGVMLMNLKLMREKEVSNQLWECKLQKFNCEEKNKLALMDQDAFNEICKNKVVPLEIKYNCNCNFYKDLDITSLNCIYNTNYSNMNEVTTDVFIIHYVGKEDKPWKYLDVCLHEYWDYYYNLSGYLTVELNRKRIQHNMKYYITKIYENIKDRGIKGTCIYFNNKIRLRGK